jgi:hypothetical protein
LNAAFKHCRKSFQAGFAGTVVIHCRNFRLKLQAGIGGNEGSHRRNVTQCRQDERPGIEGRHCTKTSIAGMSGNVDRLSRQAILE